MSKTRFVAIEIQDGPDGKKTVELRAAQAFKLETEKEYVAGQSYELDVTLAEGEGAPAPVQ